MSPPTHGGISSEIPIHSADAALPTATTAEATSVRTANDRLSFPLALRLPLACTVGSFTGLLLGLAKGSQDSGLRFTAENAHRLPTTQTGWFLYHKSKNYNMMLGGIVEGMKQSLRFGIWAGVYFVLEEGVDRGRAAGVRLYRRAVRDGEYRRYKATSPIHYEELDEDLVEEKQVAGNRDCLSSMLAGLGSAGIFSAWHKFPLPTAARTAKMGAKAGLAFGLLQDALSLLKGRRVGYIEFIKRHTLGTSDEDEGDKLLETKIVSAPTHLP